MTFINKEHQHTQSVTFPIFKGNIWVNVTTDALFAGKIITAFNLPGAFTPTCSSNHLPRYNKLFPIFKKYGIDDILCISVNDNNTFVMNTWKADQKAKNSTFIPDGNGDFTRGMGMAVSKNDLSFSKRSWRYSMLVKNCIIEKMFIEANELSEPLKVSDADTMLNY